MEISISSSSSSSVAFGMAFRYSPIPLPYVSISASTSTTESPKTQIPAKTIKLRNSKSLSTTKPAILQIHQASDLPKALARFSISLLKNYFSSSLRSV